MRTTLELGGGAAILWGLLLYLDKSGVVGPILLFCFCHELGHAWAVKAQGGKIACLRLTWAGAQIQLSGARVLPPGRMLLATLAGPGVNLLLAAGCGILVRRGMGGRLYLYAGLNLGLALFNLLPARWLDGGKLLECLLTLWGRGEMAETLLGLCSKGVAALLLVTGSYLFWESGGQISTVLLSGVWMTVAALRE